MGVLSSYEEAIHSIDKSLKENGIGYRAGILVDQVLQLVKDNKLTIQILDAAEETKQVTNKDGSTALKVFEAGKIYRGYMQMDNSVIIIQYTDQKEKK